MNKLLHKQTIGSLLLMVLFLIAPSKSGGQILGWDTNGLSGFGGSPFAPSVIDSHLSSSGLIRGSSIGTGGNAALSCWGGAGGWSTAQNDANSFYFTFQATPGYKISLSEISTATRRSNAGPTGCAVWYSVGNSPFVKIADWVTTVTSGTTGTPNSATLTGIPALQNIPEGTAVKFRLIPESTTGTGNYYITGGANSLQIIGTVEAAISPLIIPSVTSLASFGDVIVGNSSVAQSFTVDTEGLTTELSVIAPAGFEVSTDNVMWINGIDISTNGGSLDDMQIWARFSPTIVGPATGDIILLSEGAETKTVSVTGNGLPATGLYITPTVVNLSYPENGGPSQAFQLTNLSSYGLTPASGMIDIAPVLGSASNCELSIDGNTWAESVQFAYTSADNNINNPLLFVRLKAGLTEGTIPSEIINVSGGSFSTTFTVDGIIDAASTITTDEESFGPFCNGTDHTFSLDFTPNGPFSSNTFYAQLSAPDGTFPDTATNIVGTAANSPITVNIPAGTLAGTNYRIRIYNDSPLTFSNNDNGSDIILNATPTLSAVSQIAAVCDGGETLILLDGLVPGITINANYQIGNGALQTATAIIADALGQASFVVTLSAADNGQVLTITEIERTDVTPSCIIAPTENNTVELSVNPIPTASNVMIEAVCGSNTATVILQGMLPSSTSEINYTIANGDTLTLSGIIANTEGEATFTIPVTSSENGLMFNVISVTRTDVFPNCSATINGVSALLIINERPTAVISGSHDICFGNASELLQIDLTGSAPWTVTYTDGTTPVTVNNILQSPYLFNLLTLSTKTYSVVAVSDANCTAVAEGLTGSATVTIHELSNGGNIIGSNSVCAGTNSGTLTLQNHTGDVVQWQSSSTIDFSSNVSDIDNTTTVLEYNSLTANTFYRVLITNGTCPMVNSPVAAIIVSSTPAPLAQAQQLCDSSTIADLFPNGVGIQWYADITSGTPLAATDLLTTNIYYVSQTIDACESVRTSVVVTVTSVPVPGGSSNQEFVDGETLNDLIVMGSGILWYASLEDAESGNGALDGTSFLSDGATYYATQTIGECTSLPLAVTVSLTLKTITFDSKGFNFYPNPVSGILHIDSNETIEAVSVFDVLGQLIKSQEANAQQISLDFSGLPSGSYFIKAQSGKEIKTLRVIKK